MKKIIAVLLLISVLFLTSCASGISVLYYEIRTENAPSKLIYSDNFVSYSENITYFGNNGDPVYEYSVYIEKPINEAYLCNISEQDKDYALYASEGELYVKKDGRLYAILQLSGSYREYISKYLTLDHELDSGKFYQLYSEKFSEYGQSHIEVAYYSDVTPTSAAAFSELGVRMGSEIIAVYDISPENKYINSISYYTRENSDALTDKIICRREFEYSNEKKDVFSSLPSLDDTVTVKITINPGKEAESSSSFKIPRGCYIGIDTNGKSVSFFTDAELTVPFDYQTATADSDTVIYAVYN